jgi:hypothetical protein
MNQNQVKTKSGISNLSVKVIGKQKVSELMPILNHIAVEWGLDLSKQNGFDTAKRILNHSVKNN